MSAAGEPASNCHRRYDGIRSRGRKFIEEGATVVVTGRSSRSVSDAQKALNANGIAIPPMSRSPLNQIPGSSRCAWRTDELTSDTWERAPSRRLPRKSSMKLSMPT